MNTRETTQLLHHNYGTLILSKKVFEQVLRSKKFGIDLDTQYVSVVSIKLTLTELSSFNNIFYNQHFSQVREVEVTRDPGAGFGLCVKGGSEHRLPVLISRLVKGEAAERCGQLLVGDAILRVIRLMLLFLFNF